MRNKVAWMLGDPTRRIPRGGAAPGPTPTTPEDEMYVKCAELAKPGTFTALLCGPFFIGLGGNEVKSADEAIAKGATVQWVTRGTWEELDRRSHHLTDAAKV